MAFLLFAIHYCTIFLNPFSRHFDAGFKSKGLEPSARWAKIPTARTPKKRAGVAATRGDHIHIKVLDFAHNASGC